MNTTAAFFREAGTGPGVVCLHSNASTAGQWRDLMDRLSPRFRVLAPDLHGAGKSPAWTAPRAMSLSDETALVEPVLGLAGDPLCLVGHSYGGAVALTAALQHPDRVRAIAVYEPTLFALLEEELPGNPAAEGIRSAARDCLGFVSNGDHAAAARRFIDYWMGQGTWDAMPAARQAPVAASMGPVAAWASALFDDPLRLDDFCALRTPVLYMVGGKSPASSRGVARLLAQALPDVTLVEFAELGHMGPVTHPEVVNGAIEQFLDHHMATIPALQAR